MNLVLICLLPGLILLLVAILARKYLVMTFSFGLLLHVIFYCLLFIDPPIKHSLSSIPNEEIRWSRPEQLSSLAASPDNFGSTDSSISTDNTSVAEWEAKRLRDNNVELKTDLGKQDLNDVVNEIVAETDIGKIISDTLVNNGSKSGPLAFSLFIYGPDHSDLDLHVTPPGEETIYFRNRRAGSGSLDHDHNVHEDAANDRNVENIVFTEPERGHYSIGVDVYKSRSNGKPIRFLVVVTIENTTIKKYFDSVTFQEHNPKNPEWKVQFDF